MEKFIPFEKLSKKKQRELNSLRRTVWAVSPVTRRPEDPKAYKRTKTQNRKYYDSDSASFFSPRADVVCVETTEHM